jgi:predicted homoserine dehydrogenase-like protein
MLDYILNAPMNGSTAHLAHRDSPVRVGVVGAGKFATMFLNRAGRQPGVEIAWVADLQLERARAAAAGALADTDAEALIDAHDVDVVVEATGSPEAGARHALAAIDASRNVVMVTVEADALVGPELARRARRKGVVYSLAYGDQPALVCELVDWARTCAFNVVCAGKGTRYEPGFHLSTPDTVWEHYGLRPAGADARMFNSFVDGTKSAIEMAAVCNATGLRPQEEGLRFPPCTLETLPELPAGLSRSGTVEVVAGDDLRFGVYVVFEADDDLTRRTLPEYGVVTDQSGRFAALYRPYHFIGFELLVSVLRVSLDGEPTGAPEAFVADVVAVAKRDLEAGQVLDGEGGYCVYGELLPGGRSRDDRLLPIGLADGAVLSRSAAAGERIRLDAVELHAGDWLLELRRQALTEPVAAPTI